MSLPLHTERDVFVAPAETIAQLFANGQVATRYCDPEGNISNDEEWNVNGSYFAIEASRARTEGCWARCACGAPGPERGHEHLRRAGSEDL